MATKSAPPAAYYAHKPISCNACRKRKLKCDRVKPCSSCVLRGIENSCYQDEEPSQSAPIAGGRNTTETIGQPSTSRQSPNDEATTQKSESHDSALSRTSKRRRWDPHGTGAEDFNSQYRRRSDDSYSAQESAFTTGNFDAMRLKSDATNVLLDVANNIKHEMRRLEDTLAAVQQMANITTEEQAQGAPSINRGPDERVTFREHLRILPSPSVCERLLHFYCNELYLYTRHVPHEPLFETWFELAQGHAVRPMRAAQICIAMATAIVMVPDDFDLDGFVRSPATAEACQALAEGLMYEGHRQSDVVRERSFLPAHIDDDLWDGIKSAAMFVIHCSVVGLANKLWHLVSYSISLGTLCGLFDSRHAIWHRISPEGHAPRRRIAKYIVQMNHWMALTFARPYLIHPSQIHLDSDEEGNPQTLREDHVENFLEEAYKFSHEIEQGKNTYRQALQFQVRADLLMRHNIALFRPEQGVNIINGRGSLLPYFDALSRSEDDSKLEEILLMVPMAHVRCIAMRQFLTDKEAPLAVRHQALEDAQCILVLAPLISRMQNGSTPLTMSWFGHFLLCALTAFSVAYIGGPDLYKEATGTGSYMRAPEVKDGPHSAHAMHSLSTTSRPEMIAPRTSLRLERKLPPLIPAGMFNSPYVASPFSYQDLQSTGAGRASMNSPHRGAAVFQETRESPTGPNVLGSSNLSREYLHWLHAHLGSILDSLQQMRRHNMSKIVGFQSLVDMLCSVAADLDAKTRSFSTPDSNTFAQASALSHGDGRANDYAASRGAYADTDAQRERAYSSGRSQQEIASGSRAFQAERAPRSPLGDAERRHSDGTHSSSITAVASGLASPRQGRYPVHEQRKVSSLPSREASSSHSHSAFAYDAANFQTSAHGDQQPFPESFSSLPPLRPPPLPSQAQQQAHRQPGDVRPAFSQSDKGTIADSPSSPQEHREKQRDHVQHQYHISLHHGRPPSSHH